MKDEFSGEERAGFYKAVFSRRDVRERFLKKEIDEDALVRVLNAAHHAPSVGFSQPWNFVLIKDAGTKGRVKESFDEEKSRSSGLIDDPKRSQYLALKLEGIMDSPLNICVTYDPSRFGPFVIGRSSIPETGIYSVCCAIQNLWLAARVEGIGVGWVSILSNEVLRDALGLPEHVVPVAYLCLGYVEEFSKRPDLEKAGWLSRLNLKDVIFYEGWGRTHAEGWDGIEERAGGMINYP